jgi:NAD(P)-dependent dehydrogenase (short-subunit alcohol dehydrogenase family)
LLGRRIIVVGAGTQSYDDPDPPIGNGRAIAQLCAREGAQVACVDRDTRAAQATLEWILREGGRGCVITADVTSADDCERLVAESVDGLGAVDGVVLNVGVGRGQGLAGTTPAEWDLAFSVNLRGHFLVARAVMSRVTSGAALVFVSSTAGRKPGTRMPAYDSSKAGLEGLCRHVAFEGARNGVRANVVMPGFMDTPIGRLAGRGRPNRSKVPVPMARQGTAWETAYATVFLLSGEASYITGQTLIVDGGLTALL